MPYQSLLLAYLVSTVIGSLTIFPIMRYVFRRIGSIEQVESLWLAIWVGVLERGIYTTAVILGASEVIAGWLALKAAANLKAPDKQLTEYYAFLLGNGLSLAFGIGGGVLGKALS